MALRVYAKREDVRLYAYDSGLESGYDCGVDVIVNR